MKLFCAWCNTLIAEKGGDANAVSHGICDDCASQMMSEPTGLIRTFLDQLEYPVILIDSESKMFLENQEFKHKVGKTSLEIEGRKAGEVFNCINWQDFGSCGTTPQCHDCIINKSVSQTFKTGEPTLDVEASLISVNGEETTPINTHISTQKVENYVLMILQND